MPKDKNNDQFSIEDILNESYDSTESFSLESILSEYKGSAFIQGEKKTPSHELDDKVNEILRSSGVPTAEDRKRASEPKPRPRSLLCSGKYLPGRTSPAARRRKCSEDPWKYS